MKKRHIYQAKRILALLLVLAMTITMFPGITIAAGPPSTDWESNYDTTWYNNVMGAGYNNSTFAISTPAELAAFSKAVNAGKDFRNKTVSLAQNIDMSAHNWTPIGVAYYYSNVEKEFRGTFDGNDKTVTLPYLKDTGNVNNMYSLFAASKGMTVKNLTVLIGQWDTSLEYSPRTAGILGGYYIDGDATPLTITNCHVRGIDSSSYLKSSNYMGGILGDATYYSSGNISSNGAVTIENCTANIDIQVQDNGSKGTDYAAGGIAGYLNLRGKPITINNCQYNGDIKSTGTWAEHNGVIIGGIAGRVLYNTRITNCFTQGSINFNQQKVDPDDSFGGIVGSFYGEDASTSGSKNDKIDNCHSIMDVTAKRYVGGLGGYIFDVPITNSSAGGDITGISQGVPTVPVTGDYIDRVGGLVGYYRTVAISHQGNISISDSFASGNVVNNCMTSESAAGGFIGHLEGVSINSGTDGSYTSIIQNCYATGDVKGYYYAGGFVGSAAREDKKLLKCYATGDVTLASYNVEEDGDVNNTRNAVAGGFIGSWDGMKNNHILSCYATGGVKNIKNTNTSTGRNVFLGGFAGSFGRAFSNVSAIGDISTLTVSDCYYQGTITLDYANTENGQSLYVGGFAGSIRPSMDMKRCYAQATGTKLNAPTNINPQAGTFASRISLFSKGGIYPNHSIVDCYTASNLSGFFNSTNQSQNFVYYAGDHSFGESGSYQKPVLTNCYYDSDLGSTFTNTDYPEVIGKITTNMKQAATFISWTDFTNHWDITEGTTYPTLKAQKFHINQDNITSITAPAKITVASGTPFDQLPLPTVVTANANGDKTLPVKWDNGGYSSSVGERSINGDVYFGAALSNTSNQRASVTINFVPEIKRAEISGDQKVGSTLTAKGYDNDPGGNEISSGLTYQWQVATSATGNYTNINSAQASTYTPVAADENKFIRVQVSFSGKTVTSPVTAVIAKGDMTAGATNLQVVTAATSLTVSWDASNPAADSYNIYHKQSDTEITNAVDVISGGTKITNATSPKEITGLIKGKTYYIVVESVKAGYNNKLSDIAKASPNAFPTNEGTSITASKTDLYVGESLDITAATNGDPVNYAWSISTGDSISLTNDGAATQSIIGSTTKGDSYSSTSTSTVTLTVTSTIDGSKTATATKDFKVISAFNANQRFEGSPKAGSPITVTPVLTDAAKAVITTPTYTYEWGTSDTSGLANYAKGSGDGVETASYTPTAGEGSKYLVVKITMTNNGKSETCWFNKGYIAEGDATGTVTISHHADGDIAGKAKFNVATSMTNPADAAYTGKKYDLYYIPYQAGATVQQVTSGTQVSEIGTFGDTTLEATIPNTDIGKKLCIVVAIKADNFNPVYSNVIEVTPLATVNSVTITNVTTVAQAIEATAVGLSNGTNTTAVTYQWQHCATNSVNNSDWSDISSATGASYLIDGAYYGKFIRLKVTGDSVITTGTAYSVGKEITGKANFTAPPVITAAQGSNGQVTLTWTASNPVAEKYEVYYGDTQAASDVNSTTYAVTGLTNGTEYNFKVKAVKSGYTDKESASVKAMPFVHAENVSVSLNSSTVVKGGNTTATANTTPAGAGPISYRWTVSPAGAASFNDSTVATPTITANQAGTLTIGVTVTNKDGSTVFGVDTLTVTNTDAKLLTFKVLGKNAVINDTGTVELVLADSTDLTALAPEFTASLGAVVTVNNAPQTSGNTQNDFSLPITYVVTSEDGNTTKNYAVTITTASLPALDTPNSGDFTINNSGIASWSAVTDAASYLVQLYCDNNPIGSAVSISDTSHNFLADMTANGPGNYSIAVTAIADPASNLNSDESAKGGSFIMRKILSITKPVDKNVNRDTSEADAGLPTTVVATLDDGNTANIPVTWTGFDSSAIAILVLEGNLGAMPNDVLNYDSVLCPSLNVAITAPVHTIIASAGVGGIITPSGTVSIAEGGSQTFIITPNSGYVIASVIVNGNNVGSLTSVTINDNNSNQTITANFTNIGGGGSSGGGGGGSTVVTPPTTGNENVSGGNVNIDTTLNGNTANATVPKENITEAIKGAGTNSDVKLMVNTPGNASNVSLTIPASSANDLAGRAGNTVIDTGLVDFTFDQKAMNAIASAGNDNITVSVSTVNNQSLSQLAQNRIGDRPVFDLNVRNGVKNVSSFAGGTVTVSIPYSLRPGENPNSVVVYFIDDVGSITPQKAVYDSKTGSIIMKVTHFSKYAVGYNKISFNDVSSQWYAGAVHFVAARDLFSGISDNQFAPNNTMTRAMFATVLARLDNADLTAYTTSSFTDIDAKSWYGPAVAWASDKGIIKGYEDGTFRPDANITREQMAAMLNNYIEYQNISLRQTGSNSQFNDASDISSWAADAVSSMKRYGIISGIGDNQFKPQATASRAEVAQIFTNFINAYVK